MICHKSIKNLLLISEKQEKHKPKTIHAKKKNPYARKTHHQKNPTGYFYKLLKKKTDKC